MRFWGFCLFFWALTGGLWAQTDWRWEDLEIVGPEPLPGKAQVWSLVPFKAHDMADRQSFENFYPEVCRELEKRYPGGRFQAAPLRFLGGKQYLVIDRFYPEFLPNSHRVQRDRTDLSIPDEIVGLLKALEARRDLLFEQGTPNGETTDQGYKSYADPQMKELTEQLHRLVPTQREVLCDILMHSARAEDRVRAAELLNWSENHSANLRACIIALNDPQLVVRNNVSRYLLAFPRSFADPPTRRDLIWTLAEQMRRPDHADRNKALYALYELVKVWPEDAAAVKEAAGLTIERLSRQSILPNVGETAKLLLEMLPEGAGAGNATP